MYPSAYNSTHFFAFPLPQVGPNPCPEVSARADGLTKDLYYASQASAQYAENGDFTNTTWHDDDEFFGLDYISGTQPPDNATIIIVWVTAYFMSQSPDVYLLLSIDDRATWYNSDPILAAYGPISWNVTSLIAWTPQLLKSPQTWARVNCFPLGSTHYYLDYIGISSAWTVPYGGGYVPPGEVEETGGQMMSSGWLTDIFILSLLGIGFVGMIAYPGLAIYSYKSSDDKLSSLIAFISGETIFAGMVWFALLVLTGEI